METLISLIPVIASVLSTVGVALGFVYKVKSIIKTKTSENVEFRKANRMLSEKLLETQIQINDLVKSNKEIIDIYKVKIDTLEQKLATEVATNEDLKKTLDELTIVRNQIREILRRE